MEITTTCSICGEPLAAERLSRYPSARTCGVPACATEHRRTQGNTIRNRYRARRLANDPEFRVLEKERARVRYVRHRLRLGKTPAERAPVAHERGMVVAFIAAFRRSASGALRRLGITGVLGGKRGAA